MKYLASFLLFTLLISNAMQAQQPSSTFTYLIRKPTQVTSNPPLLILLHGVGSNEADLFSFANSLPGKFVVVSVRAPYTLGDQSFAWYQVDFATGKPNINKDQELHSRKSLIDFIQSLNKQIAFDPHQVYLCGFSQGAIMSYSIALTRPDLVKGIAIMSGRMLSEIKPSIASTDKLKHLEVFISHGTNDQMLGINYAREANSFLQQLHVNTSYHEYADGHTINQNMLHDLIKWLTVQVK